MEIEVIDQTIGIQEAVSKVEWTGIGEKDHQIIEVHPEGRQRGAKIHNTIAEK